MVKSLFDLLKEKKPVELLEIISERPLINRSQVNEALKIGSWKRVDDVIDQLIDTGMVRTYKETKAPDGSPKKKETVRYYLTGMIPPDSPLFGIYRMLEEPTGSYKEVLTLLNTRPEISSVEIAKELGIKHSRACISLSRLELQGIIKERKQGEYYVDSEALNGHIEAQEAQREAFEGYIGRKFQVLDAEQYITPDIGRQGSYTTFERAGARLKVNANPLRQYEPLDKSKYRILVINVPTESELAALRLLSLNPSSTAEDIAELCGMEAHLVGRDIKKLKDRKLITVKREKQMRIGILEAHSKYYDEFLLLNRVAKGTAPEGPDAAKMKRMARGFKKNRKKYENEFIGAFTKSLGNPELKVGKKQKGSFTEFTVQGLIGPIEVCMDPMAEYLKAQDFESGKPLIYDVNDLELLKRFKSDEFPDGSVPDGYFDEIKALEGYYDVVSFIKNPGKGEKRYVGYLFHRGIADTLRFLSQKKLANIRKKYLMKPVGRIIVKKGDIKGAKGRRLGKIDKNPIVYMKNYRINRILLKAKDDFELTYLLVDAGDSLGDIIRKNPAKSGGIFFDVGVLFAELQKDGFYHAEIGIANMISYKGHLKLIDLYHTRPEEARTICIVPNDNMNAAEHLFHMEAFLALCLSQSF